VSGKIKVICQTCGARYQVRDARVRGQKFRATCKRCGSVIVAQGDNESPRAGSLEEESQEVANAKDLAHAEDAASWYVVIDGKPRGPMTSIQVRKAFSKNEIDRQTYLWRAGEEEWRHLHEIPEFINLFTDPQTVLYSSEDPVDSVSKRRTGETNAASPRGQRHRKISPSPEESELFARGPWEEAQPVGGYPSGLDEAELGDLQLDEEGGMENEPTRMHIREDEELMERNRRGQDYEGPGAGVEKKDPRLGHRGWAPPPVVPPRKAMLPAPDGPLPSLGPEPSAGPSFSVSREVSHNFVEDVHSSQVERIEELAAQELASVNPPVREAWAPQPLPLPTRLPNASQPVFPAAALPTFPVTRTPFAAPQTTPDSFPDALIPLAAPAPFLPNVLRPISEEEPFWTTGKTIAVGAIGGGLAVALTIVVVFNLARPKAIQLAQVTEPSQVARKQPEATPQAPSPTAPVQAVAKGSPASRSTEKPKGAVQATPKVASAATVVRLKKAMTVEEEVHPTIPKEVKAAAPSKRPVAQGSQNQHKSIKRSKSSKSAEPVKATKPQDLSVDDLIAGAVPAKNEPGPAVDHDDLLGGGGNKKSPPASKKAKAEATEAMSDDDLLSVKKNKPSPASADNSPAKEALPVRPEKNQVQAVMRQAMPRIRNCHDKYKQNGLVTVRMTLNPTGRADVAVVGTFQGTGLGFCVQGQLENAKFPRFSGPAFSFDYPIDLK
jgi:hypothetical protein